MFGGVLHVSKELAKKSTSRAQYMRLCEQTQNVSTRVTSPQKRRARMRSCNALRKKASKSMDIHCVRGGDIDRNERCRRVHGAN